MGDCDGVFKMGTPPAVDCALGPLVWHHLDLAISHIHHWLNGQDGPRPEVKISSPAPFFLVIIGNLWLFVHLSANGMPDEVLNDGKPGVFDECLHLSGDLAPTTILSHELDG